AGVHWHQRPGISVDGRGPVPLHFKVEKSSRPQAELLTIYIYYEVAPPAVLPGAALAAIDHALANLGDVHIDGDALRSPLIAKAAPVSGESRARQEIAGVRIFRRGILRPNPCAKRDSEQKYDRYNGRGFLHPCYPRLLILPSGFRFRVSGVRIGDPGLHLKPDT